MLKVEGLCAGYGAINILWDLSFEGKKRLWDKYSRCLKSRPEITAFVFIPLGLSPV